MKHFYLLLVLCTGQAFAQAVTSKVYGPGGNAQSQPQCMAAAADSGYFMAGGRGYPSGTGDAMIVRVNKYGDTLWTAGFGTPYPDGLSGVTASYDGGCAVVGSFNLSFAQQQNVPRLVVARFNATGQALWIKSFTIPNYPGYGQSILALPDSGYLVTGNFELSAQYGYDAYVCRINSQGALLWANVYRLPYPDDEAFSSAKLCADGSILLAGTMGGPSLPNPVALLTHIDTSGNVIWSRMITTPGTGFYGPGLALKAGGGCVLTGLSMTSQALEIFAMSFDAAGDTTWTTHYGSPVNSEWGHSIAPSKHGFILCGSTESFSSSVDAWLVEIDTLGQVLWSRAYGDGNWQEGWYALQAPEGGYAVAAREQSTAGAFRYWFFETDSAGVGGLCSEYPTAAIQGFQPASIVHTFPAVIAATQAYNENFSIWRGVPAFNSCIITSATEENAAAFSVFPNPAQDELHLTGFVRDLTIRVTDLLGKSISVPVTVNEQGLSLNTAALQPGIYFVSGMSTNGKIFSAKFVISR